MFSKINEAKKLLKKNPEAALDLLNGEYKEYGKFAEAARGLGKNLSMFAEHIGYAQAILKHPERLSSKNSRDIKQSQEEVERQVTNAITQLSEAKKSFETLNEIIKTL